MDNMFALFKSLSKYNNDLFFKEMMYWFEIDKILNLQILTDDFLKKIIEKLKNDNGGFLHFSNSTTYSLSSTYLVASIVKNYFSENKEIVNLVTQNSKKLIENIENNDFEKLTKIEDIYYFFSLKKLIE